MRFVSKNQLAVSTAAYQELLRLAGPGTEGLHRLGILVVLYEHTRAGGLLPLYSRVQRYDALRSLVDDGTVVRPCSVYQQETEGTTGQSIRYRLAEDVLARLRELDQPPHQTNAYREREAKRARALLRREATPDAVDRELDELARGKKRVGRPKGKARKATDPLPHPMIEAAGWSDQVRLMWDDDAGYATRWTAPSGETLTTAPHRGEVVERRYDGYYTRPRDLRHRDFADDAWEGDLTRALPTLMAALVDGLRHLPGFDHVPDLAAITAKISRGSKKTLTMLCFGSNSDKAMAHAAQADLEHLKELVEARKTIYNATRKNFPDAVRWAKGAHNLLMRELVCMEQRCTQAIVQRLRDEGHEVLLIIHDGVSVRAGSAEEAVAAFRDAMSALAEVPWAANLGMKVGTTNESNEEKAEIAPKREEQEQEQTQRSGGTSFDVDTKGLTLDNIFDFSGLLEEGAGRDILCTTPASETDPVWDPYRPDIDTSVEPAFIGRMRDG